MTDWSSTQTTLKIFFFICSNCFHHSPSRVVGQNLQQLEVSEEKALKREESYQNQLKSINDSLKAAENREENALKNIQRMNIRIDQEGKIS